MARAAKKPVSFAAHVEAVVAGTDRQPLQSALADLILARLHKAAQRQINAMLGSYTPRQSPQPSSAPSSYSPAATGFRSAAATRTRKPRRTGGRIRFYTATNKPDISRHGTFRRYMITTIREHSNTDAANRAHMLCTEPKFAKNRLDFNWAADNGFINWN